MRLRPYYAGDYVERKCHRCENWIEIREKLFRKLTSSFGITHWICGQCGTKNRL